MSDLIKQTITEHPVNARELHEFLESKQEFANWIQNRIEEYGFTQDVDFVVLKNDYFLSQDMGKELAMVERTAKGKEERRYFIACEKKLKEQSQLCNHYGLSGITVKFAPVFEKWVKLTSTLESTQQRRNA
jgi:anti-repressor protein